MNLLLFKTRGGQLYPIVQKVDEDHPRSSEPTGRWTELKVKLHKGYLTLAEKFSHDELVCASLRHAVRLNVRHSSRSSSDAVEKTFRQFLKLRYSKHTRWLWVDLVLAFFGIFLMFIPGPNVFFFYPAIRSLGHYHARSGARNILSLEHVSFGPEPLIDEIAQRLHDGEDVKGVARELEKRYLIDDLPKLLMKLKEK